MSQLNANSLIDRIRAGIKTKSELLWPGSEDVVYIRVLSKAELQEASFAAAARFRAKNADIAVYNVDVYKDEETIQILWRALSDADGRPIGANVDAFRALLTTDVQTELAAAYAAHETENSPDPERMSDEDYARLEAELKKKPEAIIGSVSNIVVARRLLRSLVSPPEN